MFASLSAMFLKLARCKYDAIKWLVKHMVLCIGMPHQLWLELCWIVHERLISKIMVEDHCHFLCPIKELCTQVNISNTIVLHQYKDVLNKVITETLRDIAHEQLSHLRDNSQQT